MGIITIKDEEDWEMKPYDKKFKEEAVKMAGEVGTAKAAQDLGISVNTLYTWTSRAREYGTQAHVGSGRKRQGSESDEMARMSKRIRELEKANQILKEALGFFAVSQKR
jgi:transposase